MDIRELVWQKLYHAESATSYYAEKAKRMRYTNRVLEVLYSVGICASLFILEHFAHVLATISGIIVVIPFIAYYRYRSDRLNVYVTARTFQHAIAQGYSELFQSYDCEIETDVNAVKMTLAHLETQQRTLDVYVSQYFPYTDDKVAARAEDATKQRYFGDELQGEGGH